MIVIHFTTTTQRIHGRFQQIKKGRIVHESITRKTTQKFVTHFSKKEGGMGELNPRPLVPKTRIIPLDQFRDQRTQRILLYGGVFGISFNISERPTEAYIHVRQLLVNPF